MARIRPSGVTNKQLVNAFAAFSDITGPQWASQDQQDAELYIDSYNPGEAHEFIAGGFVAPANVEQVQEILKVANRYKVPLWPLSTGKNLAYGGAAPLESGTIALDLKRMDKILEVNEELAYAVVEPGVSFFDLHHYLKQNNHKLWMSVPGPGWGSIIGNGLEHGVGYGYDSDHFASSCGMEVVLPDGELLRTGMGAMSDNESWHTSNYGFGPVVDGLFSQSNYGVVTKMGRFLYPEPAAYMGCEINCKTDAGLEPLIDALRPFKLDDTIPNPVVISNLAIIASFFSVRDQWYDGDGPIPAEVWDKVQQKLNLGRWNAAFGLYGREDNIQADWKTIKKAVSHIPDLDFIERFYHQGDPIQHPRDMSQAGIPNLSEFGLVNWLGSGGHIDFSPVAPLTKEHARRALNLVQSKVESYGFDFLGGFYCDKRFFRLVCTLIFRKNNPEEMRRVRSLFKELVSDLAEAGYAEYRTHLAYMEQVASSFDYNNNAMLRFQQSLKDTIDPNGIIAPGKSGIWPGGRKS